jgi:tRNA A-37 threonylcarbamoyl transferase component Bud32
MPFSLRLRDGAEGGGELVFHTILRSLPGQRVSGLALWRRDEAFAKLFTGRRARIHCRREEQGLRALHDAKLAAPRILYSGLAEDGYVLITECLAPAKTARELWSEAADDDARLELLLRLVQVVASHHNAGLQQRDLHLNNFLAAHEKIYTLDGAGIVQRAPGKAAALDNLGLLFAQVEPRFDRFAHEVFWRYAPARGWGLDEHDVEGLSASIARNRKRKKEKYLDKIFRDCTAFKRQADFWQLIIYDRAYDSPSFSKLLADPNAALQGPLLKDGNTSTIGQITVDGGILVVKRYNTKSFSHGLSRAFRSTRAACSWRNGHLLQLHAIMTAKPVALIERRLGLLRSTSYFVSEYVSGPNIREFLVSASPESGKEIIQKTVDMLLALASLNLSHGDLKATNIVISNGEPVLLDLDSMQKHRTQLSLKRALAHDAKRLLANWGPQSDTYKIFEAKLRALLP